MRKHKFEVHDQDVPADLKFLENKISEFNGPELAGERRALNIICKNEDGDIIAGLGASTNWGWLYIRLLWVSEEMRGQNLGRELVLAAENAAVKRDCHGVWVDTFSVRARGFYEKLDYSVFGVLDQFPKDNQRFFLSKPLGLK